MSKISCMRSGRPFLDLLLVPRSAEPPRSYCRTVAASSRTCCWLTTVAFIFSHDTAVLAVQSEIQITRRRLPLRRVKILAGGLSPLVRVLRKCWHEPYVSPETVEAALVVFGAWAAVSDDTGRDYEGETGEEHGGGGGGRGARVEWWRWSPLEATVSEVVTLVAVRLVSLMEEGQEEAVTAFTSSQRSCDASGGGDGGRAADESATGRDAQILLMALDAAAAAAAASPWGLRGYQHQARPPAAAGPASSFSSHPSVVALGGKCVSLLSAGGGGGVRLPPTTHLLAIASLEVIVRARGGGGGEGLPAAGWDEARCKEVAVSLLLNKVEGRVTSSSTGKGD